MIPSAAAQAKGAAAMRAKADSRASDLMEIIEEIRAGGAISLREIAAALKYRGIPSARGGAWSAVQVSRVLARSA